ncbi:MAG: hypothetical protein U9N58_00635 [Thermodesulfobacteriota bacterium]|nr:hypothetical protein [Thermodesulfobacteriota bacterium]
MSPICRPIVDTLPELGREVPMVYQGLRIVVGIAVILSIFMGPLPEAVVYTD